MKYETQTLSKYKNVMIAELQPKNQKIFNHVYIDGKARYSRGYWVLVKIPKEPVNSKAKMIFCSFVLYRRSLILSPM